MTRLRPAHDHRDWRQRLDARITTCPGCDQWRWDAYCSKCDEHPARAALRYQYETALAAINDEEEAKSGANPDSEAAILGRRQGVSAVA